MKNSITRATARKLDGAGRATIDDVARHAHVSIATVSRVLNNQENVAPKTATRVRESIAALGYVPHAAARGLAGSKTNTIGLIVPAVNTPFLNTLIGGVNSGAYESGLSLLVYSAIQQASVRNGQPFPLGDHNADGLIIFTDTVDDATIRLLHARGFPLVLLNRTPPADVAEIPCLGFHNREGTVDLMNHLIQSCGHRRIVFLTGPAGNEDSEQREQGYRAALAANGIAVDESLIWPGRFERNFAEQEVARRLADGATFDAIFAGDDGSAFGTITALRNAGLCVPQDVAVVGFNDDLLSRYFSPPLTTVAVPLDEFGRSASQQLARLIRGEQVAPQTRFYTQLVVRESCGINRARGA